jgi:uncharacterized membrane protein YesL
VFIVVELYVTKFGVALTVFAYYYIQAARQEMKAFFVITIHGRILQFVLFVGLVVAGIGQPILLLFAGVELASGIWTWFALRNS